MMLVVNLELTRSVLQGSSQRLNWDQDHLVVNTILNSNQNLQWINLNNLVELDVPGQSFISQSQIMLVARMTGIVKVDKCHNFHIFQNEDLLQRYIKVKKRIPLMTRFLSKEEPILQLISFRLKSIKKVIKNWNKSTKKKHNLLKQNWTNVSNLKIMKTTTN